MDRNMTYKKVSFWYSNDGNQIRDLNDKHVEISWIIQNAMFRVITFEQDRVPLRCLDVIFKIYVDSPFPSSFLPCVYTYNMCETKLSKTYITENQRHLLPLHSHESFDCFMQDPFSLVLASPTSMFFYLKQVPHQSFCKEIIDLIFDLTQLQVDISFLT